MRLLLDTCVLLWLAAEPDRLSDLARQVVDDVDNDLAVSHVSVWELALKNGAGKLNLPAPLRTWMDTQHREWGFEYLPIGLEHVMRTCELHRHHVDPFDRLIVAQAIVDGLAIVTPDDKISSYPVHVIW